VNTIVLPIPRPDCHSFGEMQMGLVLISIAKQNFVAFTKIGLKFVKAFIAPEVHLYEVGSLQI
jgi:hypothetical protein